MGVTKWVLEGGEWVCYVDESSALRISEREMNQTADEKGDLEKAQSYYLRLYLLTSETVS